MDWLAKLDRRWLFLCMGLAVIVPIVLGVDLAPPASPNAHAIYDAVEALPAGSKVLVSCDYDPGSEAEIYPMNLAVFHHLARKDCRIIITQLWPQAGPLVIRALDNAYYTNSDGEATGKMYGKDVANLGYKTGGQILISKMLQSIRDAFPEDVNGTPVSEIPAMEGIAKLDDFDMFIILSAGTPGTKEWVQQCQSRLGKPMASGVTAVSAPDFFAYVNSGQLIGLLGGLRGASDYEKLVNVPGRGMAGMGSQLTGHLLIVFFILIGNVGYFLGRRKAGRA
ncbi:MAG: hypothetical protein ABFS86_15985 [Planctomycetota bacterium]